VIRVERSTDAADLALADRVDAEGLDDVIDAARADTADAGLPEREDDAVAVPHHDLPAAVTPALGT
jgi:hypothetical protein